MPPETLTYEIGGGPGLRVTRSRTDQDRRSSQLAILAPAHVADEALNQADFFSNGRHQSGGAGDQNVRASFRQPETLEELRPIEGGVRRFVDAGVEGRRPDDGDSGAATLPCHVLLLKIVPDDGDVRLCVKQPRVDRNVGAADAGDR